MARLVVSQNERILLHLLEMEEHRDEPEVPLGASQEGIANRLGTQVHNASRALSALESEGLVTDRLAHIRGAPKRRRAYFLTDRGHRAARKAMEGMMASRLVYEERGRAEEVPVSEAVKRFRASTGTDPGFLDLVDFVRENDVVRSDELLRRLSPASRKERYVESAFGRPVAQSFFGREKEMALLTGHVDGDSSVMLVWGIPGIGKTSLASKLFDGLSGRRHLFWYAFHPWDTEEHFLSVFSRFLESAGRTSTASEVRRGASTGDLFAPLMSDMTALDSVLFFDDLHKASEKLGMAISIVLEAVRASGTAKAVLMSREVPSFFSKTSEGNSTLELSGLDQASARKLAESSMAGDPAKAVDASRGHPLLLRLMSRSGVSESRGDILSFMDREVSLSLEPQERRVLDLLSVYRHPVPADAVIDGDNAPLVGLRDKSLIVEQEGGVWTHDLLREFFGARMSADARRSFHSRAAEYCERQDGADWMLEALHHYVEADDFSSATRVAIRTFQDLYPEFPGETHALLMRVRPHADSDEDAGALDFRLGQLSEALGDDAGASGYYTSSLESMSEEGGPGEKAQVLEALGKLKTRVEQWTESFAAHERALRIYEKAGDRAGQIREWSNIGAAHRKRGDFTRAREAYDEALSLASKDEDRAAQAACMNNIALLDWDQGRLKEAEAGLKESIRLAHAVRNHAGEARGLENLAGLYRLQARVSEMTRLLMESSEAFRRAGEVEEFKRLQAACAETLGSQGRVEEGIDLCREALSSPELRRRTGLLRKGPRSDRGDAALSFALIGLLRSSGDLKGAEAEIARLTEVAVSLDDQVLRSKAKLELALVRESSGDLVGAASQLIEAEKLLNEVGDRAGLVAVHLMLGNIREKEGDYDAARAQYTEAVRQAESLGDEAARESAAANLRSLDGTVD